MGCELSKEQAEAYTEEFGSPLYIFHKEEFRKNCLDLLGSMRRIYPNYNIAYSFKTNYTPEIVSAVKELGGLAEVVSEMEYTLARRLGYENKAIVYNGPVKGKALFEHLSLGGTANIDSLDELETVLEFARNNRDLPLKLAFRVNIDIGQGFVSRFGLDAYEEPAGDSELDRAFALVRTQPNIRITGLHCHIGKSRTIEAWKNRIRIMFRLIDRYFGEIPEFIDFGSGMNSVMEPSLARQFGSSIPDFDEYAETLAGAVRDRYASVPDSKKPLLCTEPGTTLISGCVSFLGSVVSVKTVKGKTFVTFDCSGGNLGDICRLKQLPVSVFHTGQQTVTVKDAVFAGYTCLEHDTLYEGFSGEIAVGDLVQFRNIGSYSNVFKPPFIAPDCAMIALDENGIPFLIRRKETAADVFRTYLF